MDVICSNNFPKTLCSMFIRLMIWPWFTTSAPGKQFGLIAGVTERILRELKQLMLLGHSFVVQRLHAS